MVSGNSGKGRGLLPRTLQTRLGLQTSCQIRKASWVRCAVAQYGAQEGTGEVGILRSFNLKTLGPAQETQSRDTEQVTRAPSQ